MTSAHAVVIARNGGWIPVRECESPAKVHALEMNGVTGGNLRMVVGIGIKYGVRK